MCGERGISSGYGECFCISVGAGLSVTVAIIPDIEGATDLGQVTLQADELLL